MWYSAVGFVVTLTLSLLVGATHSGGNSRRLKFNRIGRLRSGSPLPGPDPSLENFRKGCVTSAMSRARTLS